MDDAIKIVGPLLCLAVGGLVGWVWSLWVSHNNHRIDVATVSKEYVTHPQLTATMNKASHADAVAWIAAADALSSRLDNFIEKIDIGSIHGPTNTASNTIHAGGVGLWAAVTACIVVAAVTVILAIISAILLVPAIRDLNAYNTLHERQISALNSDIKELKQEVKK